MSAAVKLAQLRAKAKISQGAMARRYRCSQAFVSMVESGRRSPPAALVALYIERCNPSEEEKSALLEGVVMEQAVKRRGK